MSVCPTSKQLNFFVDKKKLIFYKRNHFELYRLDYCLLGLHSDYTFEMMLCGGMGAFVYDIYLFIK